MTRSALIPSLLATLLGALLVVPACSRDKGGQHPGSPDSRRALARLDEHLSLGEPVTEGNLTVWPVFTDQPLDLGEFVTLEEALESNAAVVREVGGGQERQCAQVTILEVPEGGPPAQSDESRESGNGEPLRGPQANSAIGQTGGPFQDPAQNAAIGLGGEGGRGGGARVGTLVIENKGELPILICAGTVVKGGNQDRQIGQDFVVQAKTAVPVDAFCVEQGRWSGQRLGEATDGRFRVAAAQAMSQVRSKGQYANDQGEVWQEVEKVKKVVLAKLDGSPAAQRTVAANSSLAIALDSNEQVSGKGVDALCLKVKRHFESFGTGRDAPVGFAYAVNGKPVNVRTFAHERVFARQFDVFARTMATEALLADTQEFEPATAEDVLRLVKDVEAADEKLARTRALNSNGQREGVLGYYNSCYLPGEDRGTSVVLTRDWTAK